MNADRFLNRQFTVTGGATLTAGTCSGAFTVTHADASGNVTNVSTNTTVQLAGEGTGDFYSDFLCTTPASSVVMTAGTSSQVFYFKSDAATAYALQASATSVSPGTLVLGVVAAAADHIAFTVSPAGGTYTAGTAFSTQPVVGVYDVYGNLRSTLGAGTMSLSISAGVLSGGGTSGVISGGLATFAGVATEDAGTGLTVTATYGALTVTSGTFVVNPGAAASLAFTTTPAGGTYTAGTAFPGGNQPVVTIYDAYGNVLTNVSSGTMSLSISAGALSAGATSGTIASGVATFAGVMTEDAGTGLTVTATYGALTVTSGTFDVSPAAAASIAFTTSPAGGTYTAGTIFPAMNQPVVTIYDAYGNVLTGVNAGTMTLAISAGALTGGGTSGVIAAGVASFSGVETEDAGTGLTVTATYGALTVTSGTFVVNPAAAASIAFTTSPAGGTYTAGTAFPGASQPVVAIYDTYGNVLTNVSAGTMSLSISAGALSGGGTSGTIASGVATFSGVATENAGTGLTVTATYGVLTVTSGTFVVSPGAAHHLVFSTDPGGGSYVGGVDFATQPEVTINDIYGNVLTGLNTGTVSLTLSSGSLTAGATSSTITAGVAVFSGVRTSTAGAALTVTASYGALPTLASGAFSVTVSFVATAGVMSSARYGHTATLLPNGLVLIVGGSNGTAVASADLYDPATRTFTATGSLSAPRTGHSATLLNNGKVLIVGGQNQFGGYPTSAEIYDPGAGTFGTAAGTAGVGRIAHTATALASGLVLIAGGTNNFGALAHAELYDPTTEGFTATSTQLTGVRYAHSATLLPSNKVLIAGGSNGAHLATAELYDPVTATFAAATNSMLGARANHSALLLGNGLVFISGGGDSGGALTATELYDPVADDFTAETSLSRVRTSATAVLLADGKVLIAGSDTTADGDGEVYDPATHSMSFVGYLTTSRFNFTVTLLPNGRVLIAGGLSVGFYDSAEEYQ